MTDSGERSYAYAKASGIIAKSFVGNRARNLEKAGRLSELDRLVFSAGAKNLPEKELLRDLEKRIINREVNSIISIVKCFSHPPEFFKLLIRSYEYSDLLSAIIAAKEKERKAPAHVDLGFFQTVRFEAWPDIPKMIEGTAFDFLLEKLGKISADRGSIPEKPGLSEKQSFSEKQNFAFQSLLDQHYYTALWKALFLLPEGDRQTAEKILSDEISLKNASWALRLRVFYQLPDKTIKQYLVDIPEERHGPSARYLRVWRHEPDWEKKSREVTASLVHEAIVSLDYQLDDYSDWSSWRWKDFLNPQVEGRHWQADPRFFQNAASRYLYNLARHNFRFNPSSLDTIFCFIKLKQFEEDILTSSVEGLGIGMSVRDTLSMLGVE
jgi:vacuolar-type H+-ATPase subunit C/Vma6